MNFFYPSLLIFLIALIVLFSVIPRFTPLIMALLSGVLLAFGIYHHYQLFKNEYQRTTWTDNLKIYAPALMIAFTILLIIYGIFGFFAGSVPVPSMPTITTNLSLSSPNKNLTNTAIGTPVATAVNALNSIKNTFEDIVDKTVNTVNSVTNTVTNTVGNIVSNTGNTLKNVTGNNKNNNKLF